MKILTLIPARMGSSRLPGKPMKELLGKPMIGHVYERVIASPIPTLTAVATCDEVIADYVRSIGGEAVMTASTHERASDRCAEALLKIEEERGEKFDIVVMVQGDEPMTHPEMIAESVNPLLFDEDKYLVNLLGEIADDEEFESRNCIKVVCDLAGNALYFSREPIPTRFQEKRGPIKKQVCVIAFRRDLLLAYNSLKPTPLEIAESIDMMRVLEHGMKVFMAPTKHTTHAVDTLEDLKKVEVLMKNHA